jgi:hypothetical protein
MSALFLTDEELQELTRRARHSAQVRALRRMGIEHRVRPDGSVLVLRSHVTELFGASSESSNDQEPDWNAI